MGRRGMPGRRRQVLQLDENTKTSYLTQTGCYRPDDMFIESKNSAKTGLSLVGEYSDSESDSEGEAEQTDLDVESKFNGDAQIKGEENQPVQEKNDSLQAEMLEIVGAKKETSADIFLREFQAYQKESAAPVYNREFIAFQKESKENVENSPTSSSSSSKDVQKENSTKDSSSLAKNNKASTSGGTKAPDIDSQVASFLAEIDALGDEEEKEKTDESNEIGTNDNSSVDHNQNGQSSMAVSDSQNKDSLNGNSIATGSTSKTAKEEVEENAAAPLPPPPPPQEEKIVWPEEPATEWQQCYDENTQHCYYWNINTNEVTWEIPPEFTQYLLLYREYEEKMAKLMKDGKMKPKKKKLQKKSEKSKSKQSENESETSSKDLNTMPQVEYGPHLPPSSNNQKDTCSSPETVGPATSGQESSKESMEPIFGPMQKPDTVLEGNKEKGDESDASSSSSTGKQINNTTKDNVEEEENNIMDNKKPVAAAASATPVTDTGSPADSTTAVNVSTTCVNEGSKGDSLTADLVMIELCKKKFKARINREEESGKLSGALSLDSATKGNSLSTDLEESLLDIDEVDRELELALERKKNELKSLEEEEEKQSHESVKVRGKRKYHDRASDDSSADEISTQKSSKRSRDQRPRDHRESSKHSKKTKHKKGDTNGISSDDSSPPSTTSRKSRSSDQKKSHRSHQSKKESRPKKSKDMLSSKEHADSKSRSCDDAEENKFKESALDLSQLVMDKMDFLEIDISKQSKLQVLYVQLKTRISDWHAGGLSTKYFYVKLQEANQQLGQYEKSGAPAGWSVNWDRTCKRYFYTNNTTGHSQWEYPDQLPKEEGNELPDSLCLIAGSLPLPLLPPPPPPPPSSSPSSLEKDALEEADKEHQKIAKECERRERSSSEKEKYSSSKSEGRKEKRSRKESKSSKSSRSKDSSKSKSHSENSTCSKLKDYDCEMSIYPGEPPPPGTETNLQPANTIVSSTSISQANSPQLDNKDPLSLTPVAEDDLEDVMNLASSLNKSTTVCTSASGLTEDIDDMEIDPEDEVTAPAPALAPSPAPAPVTLLPLAEFKISPANAGSNGTVVSMPDPISSHTTNSSAVISKPPHITRPPVSVEALPVSAVSSHESNLSYSGRMEASVGDGPNMSHLSLASLSDLPNESSNSPKPADNNEATEPIKSTKEKRKKKDKVITGTSLTLKKKNVSSLVQKWQKVKKEVEKEDELARHEFSDGD